MKLHTLPTTFGLAFLVGLLGPVRAADDPSGPTWGDAQWIWSSSDAVSTSRDFQCFRKKLDLPAKPEEATIVLTADNGFDLFVNGQEIAGETGADEETWNTCERFCIERYLVAGANVIAVRGENLGGPAGIVATIDIALPDGKHLAIGTDENWLTSPKLESGWTQSDHDDSLWSKAVALGRVGMAPWGALEIPQQPSTLKPRRTHIGEFTAAPAEYAWPEGVVFVADPAPLNSTPGAPQAKWEIQASRAFFEHDTPMPPAIGHKLMTLVPARPGVQPRVLIDAGAGVVGMPSASYDGSEVFFSMAPEGEKFFKLYRVAADGSGLTRLTEGPWHDYDPAMLPDGRVIFSSTRIGSRDEYHANTARSLFVLETDRQTIHPFTQHIVGDSEPAVMADGRIAFVRSDNFLERAKVETHIHVVRPDGTAGEVLLGPNRGPIGYDRATAAEEDALWLRTSGFGCPAPLPDGRVACLSHLGLVVSPRANARPFAAQGPPDKVPLASDLELYDIAPLNDGRLLCTVNRGEALGILDPNNGKIVLLYQAGANHVHSVKYLGPRPRPPVISSQVKLAGKPGFETGLLLCQNLYASRQSQADWKRVVAVRVFEGRPMTTRSAHHPYDHIGVEGVELGTVPVASDGSFFVRVPADRALAMQAVDAEGRAVVNELSWIFVRPGEQRSCTGCHDQRQHAPTHGQAIAARFAPIDLTLQTTPHRFRANNAANGGVLNLQLDRFREAASIDLYSQPTLSRGAEPAKLPAGRSNEVARLRQLVVEGTTGERISAANRLAIFRDRTAVPELVAALKHDEPSVRISAAVALAPCGTREAVPALVEALIDAQPHVAQAAKMALEHLTGHAEPLDLYSSAAARQAARECWQTWLSANAWDRIESQLIARLADQDPQMVELAIESLGHVGAAKGAAALRSELAEGKLPGLRAKMEALRALGHLHDTASIGLLSETLLENIRETEFDPPKSHEFGWAQEPVQLAGAAAEALGWIGTAEAEASLLDAFAKLAPFWYYTFRTGDHSWLMGCHSSVPHARILEALDEIGSSKAAAIVPAILRSVPMDPDRGLLYENDAYETLAARVIHRSGRGAEAIETCLAVLGDSQAKAVEELTAAVTASPPAISVGILSPEARAAHLLSVLAIEPRSAARVADAFTRFRQQSPSATKSWACFMLARTLGKLGEPRTGAALLAALTEDATEAAQGIPNPPNVFLYHVITPAYRAAAADALGRVGAKSAADVLLKTVGNYENAMEVRQAAARSLGRICSAGQLAKLEALARDYPEVATQRTLWESAAAVRDRTPKIKTALSER